MNQSSEKVLSELRYTLGKMEIALGSIEESILWTDDGGKIQWCNTAFDRLVDLQHISVLGRDVTTLLPLEENGVLLPKGAHPVSVIMETQSDVHGYYSLSDSNLFLELIGKYLDLEEAGRSSIVTIRDITESKELEQTKLQSVALQTAANAIAITDRKGKINWVNQAFTNLTGYSLQEIYQKDFSLLKSDKTPPSLYEGLWKTILAGKVWTGRLVNRKKDGTFYSEEQTITPVLTAEGQIGHFIAIKQDVTEKERVQIALEKSNVLLKAVGESQLAFISNEDIQTVFEKLLDSLLSLTDSEYGFIGEVLQTAQGTPDLKTIAGTHAAWYKARKSDKENTSKGPEFTFQQKLFDRVMASGRPVIFNEPDNDLLSGGRPEGHPPLSSFLGVPLASGTTMIGMIGVANRPDGYDEELVAFLAPFLNTCGYLIEAYRNDMKRVEAERGLRSSEARISAILRTAADSVITVTQEGIIESVNPAAEKLFGYRADELVGQNIEILMPPPYRQEHKRSFKKYFEADHGEQVHMGKEVEGLRKDGATFPLELSVSEMWINERRMFTGIIRDITERKRSEEKLARQTMEANLLYGATDIASESTSMEEAFHACVNLFCRVTGWPIGHVYLLAEDETGELYPTKIWYLKDPDGSAVFKAVTEKTRFAPGVGLPGRILSTGEPVWIHDVQADENFPRAKMADDIGVRGAFGFPVKMGDKTLAVFEFFSNESMAADKSLMEIMKRVGDQMGRVLERRQAEMQIQQRAQLLALGAGVGKAITEGAELQSMLDRCAQAVVDNLGAAFARIWLLNDAKQLLELKASAGMYTHLDGPHGRIPVGKLKVGLIAQTGRPHLTNDVLHDPRIGDKAWARREGMVAFAGYPLKVEDRLVGVMPSSTENRSSTWPSMPWGLWPGKSPSASSGSRRRRSCSSYPWWPARPTTPSS
jgi:PAS domain S-box-containing protein